MWYLLIALYVASLCRPALVSAAADDEGGTAAKIFRGRVSMQNEHPWLVWIGKGDNLVCHGSLVHKLWVLTTASCITDGSPREFRIMIGDLRRGISDGEQQNKVQLIVTHPSYVAGSHDYDIAMVKLKRPASMRRRWVMSVPRLAALGVENNTLANNNIKCRIAGWGEDLKKGDWRPVARLQHKFIDFHDNRKCHTLGDFNDTTSLCYMGTPCNGDEGVPIICYISKTWVQVGMHVYHMPENTCTGGENVALSIAFFRNGDEGVPIICYISKNWVQVGMHVYHMPENTCTGGEHVALSIAYFRKWIKRTIRKNSYID